MANNNKNLSDLLRRLMNWLALNEEKKMLDYKIDDWRDFKFILKGIEAAIKAEPESGAELLEAAIKAEPESGAELLSEDFELLLAKAIKSVDALRKGEHISNDDLCGDLKTICYILSVYLFEKENYGYHRFCFRPFKEL
jgi:hypothetical protein